MVKADNTKGINEFVVSLVTEKNSFISTEGVIKWLKERNASTKVNITKIAFEELRDWAFDSKKKALAHSTGKFFTIEGINVKTNWGNVFEWEQPIINQPEIGYLGIIAKEFEGVLHFLMQAKIEPGNVNNVQLSPTLQATKSNYTQVHKGKKPLYLEYFKDVKKEQILLDQLQSEQGARFLKKRNRNIIIKVEDDIKVHEDFVWLTLAQIKKLSRYDNLVNMDTRTVISGIPFAGNIEISLPEKIQDVFLVNSFETGLFLSALKRNNGLHSLDGIINWLTALKSKYELDVTPVDVFNIKDWVISESEIHHKEHKFFKVIATEVEISNREVKRWTQPLVQPAQDGIIAFIVKKINGIYHFLVQAKMECGNFDVLELAPTVQCLTGSYEGSENLPFLNDVLNAKPQNIKFSNIQSEEGGRFYREQNKNILIEAESDFPIELPENYIWMTLGQLNTFIKFNNYLNIQARSLLSAINFI